MTDLVTKVVATASYLGECPLKMCSFLYLENVTKYGAVLYSPHKKTILVTKFVANANAN